MLKWITAAFQRNSRSPPASPALPRRGSVSGPSHGPCRRTPGWGPQESPPLPSGRWDWGEQGWGCSPAHWLDLQLDQNQPEPARAWPSSERHLISKPGWKCAKKKWRHFIYLGFNQVVCKEKKKSSCLIKNEKKITKHNCCTCKHFQQFQWKWQEWRHEWWNTYVEYQPTEAGRSTTIHFKVTDFLHSCSIKCDLIFS